LQILKRVLLGSRLLRLLESELIGIGRLLGFSQMIVIVRFDWFSCLWPSSTLSVVICDFRGLSAAYSLTSLKVVITVSLNPRFFHHPFVSVILESSDHRRVAW